ncbi:hypothetical protein LPJ73_005163, partial [Coemansia sp. RSA 2703]
ILFLDEIDSIAGARQSGGEQTARLVAQLLTLMDGAAARGQVVVVGATNRADALDAALRRPGRFDREIHVRPPDEAARLRILQHCARALPLDASVDLALLAAAPTSGWVAADLAALCAAAASCAAERRQQQQQPACVAMGDFARALATVAPAARRQQTTDVGTARWADVQGLADVSLRLRQAVEWPVARRAAMQRLGVRAPRGVLLHGPPGCSKTTLVRALAGESRAAFFALSGASVYSAFVGESERRVRGVFAQARAARPAVVFLDEIDAMVGRRSGGGGGGGGGDEVRERVVATLLNEMDGVDGAAGDGGVLVVAATNRIDLVDNALLRPGRFDRVLYVPPPDECARGDILRARLAGMPQDAAAAVDVAALAQRTCGFSGADLANLCREAAMVALRRGVQRGAAGVAAVAMDDFERALGVVQPSLTADVLRFYAGIEREYLRQALHQTLSVGPDHGAVLALAQTRDLLIAGTQRGDILAWSRTTFRRTHAAQGAHAAGCLSLALDSAQHVLFSGGGDGRVRAWDARTLAPLYTVHAGENAGGVLALAYFGRLDALALGCQNASVQWFDVGRRRAMVGDELAERRSRFFDARADSGSASPDPSGPAYVVDERCIAAYAHSGYVYCALAGQLADGRAAL